MEEHLKKPEQIILTIQSEIMSTTLKKIRFRDFFREFKHCTSDDKSFN